MRDAAGAYIQGAVVGAIIGLVVGIALGWWLASQREAEPQSPQVITIRKPQPAEPDTVIRYITRRLPAAPSDSTAQLTDSTAQLTDSIARVATESGDSADVILPITQRVYTDSLRYRAVVEGYEPRLVSLDLYPQTILPTSAKRWHIGPAVGVGWDGKRIAPFAGVTLTYSLYGF